MSVDDGLVMQIHPGSFRNHNPQVFRAVWARQRRRHPDAHRLRARAETAARQRRQRARPDDHPVHARRDELRARARAAGRALPGAETRSAVVVPRQLPGHAALPRAGDRDRRLLRIPSGSTTTRAPSCRFRRATTCGGASCAASSPRRSSSTASARTRRWSWRPHSRATSRRPRTSFSHSAAACADDLTVPGSPCARLRRAGRARMSAW